jgi:hypothetical protein
MFAERARNIFGHMSIFISACLLGVFAMSSEIVTGRSFGFLLGRTVRYVAQNTRAVLTETFFDPCRDALVEVVKPGKGADIWGKEDARARYAWRIVGTEGHGGTLRWSVEAKG